MLYLCSPKPSNMPSLNKFFTIDRSYFFKGNKEDFFNQLEEIKGIKFESEDYKLVKIYPTTSWGTLTFNINSVQSINGIHVLAHVNFAGEYTSKETRLKIIFKSSLRPEHYFLAAIFFIIFIGTIFSNTPVWVSLMLPGIWIISHLRFQIIFRLQQNNVIDKVVRNLSLDIG